MRLVHLWGYIGYIFGVQWVHLWGAFGTSLGVHWVHLWDTVGTSLGHVVSTCIEVMCTLEGMHNTRKEEKR